MPKKLPYKIKKRPDSQYYQISFFVNKSYSKNGMFQKSLKETREREANKKAQAIFNDFNFAQYEAPTEVLYDDVAKIMLKKRLRKYIEKYPNYNEKRLTPYKEKLRYEKEMKPHLGSIPIKNTDMIEDEFRNVIDRLKTHGTTDGKTLKESTINKYCNLFNLIQNEALGVHIFKKMSTPYVRRRNEERPPYRMLEIKQITDRLREEPSVDRFYLECADFVELLTAIPTRPGLEPLNIKIKDCVLIKNIKHNEEVLRFNVYDTKTKPVHTYTASPHFVTKHYPRIVSRNESRDCSPEDYLFFPEQPDRNKTLERIRKNFVRISKELGLYYFNGLTRPMYSIRHLHAKKLQKEGLKYDDIAFVMNTSVPVLMSTYLRANDDYNVLETHNRIYNSKKI